MWTIEGDAKAFAPEERGNRNTLFEKSSPVRAGKMATI
ncbi:hypothetical protein HAPAU_32820 [Halalkalicoccus paucihalophilus]|uniref:Uncharacterized protein n=1 Tax=Halalkalicoccus paucihalophilus TaxID=1008153 RepID=A0A151A9K7_9EURY|nr:hypothetical protein HAPAU_32820 [Halalkalicoccus paucihalophilus]